MIDIYTVQSGRIEENFQKKCGGWKDICMVFGNADTYYGA